MLEYGKISLDRQICGWEWYKDSSTKCVFLHLLLQANYEDNSFRGRTIKRGQLVTSLNSLCEQTGICRHAVVRALDNLVSTGEITRETPGHKMTLITIVRYDDYQGMQPRSKRTTKRTTMCTTISTTNSTTMRTQCNNTNEVKEVNKNSLRFDPDYEPERRGRRE